MINVTSLIFVAQPINIFEFVSQVHDIFSPTDFYDIYWAGVFHLQRFLSSYQIMWITIDMLWHWCEQEQALGQLFLRKIYILRIDTKLSKSGGQ